MSVEKSSLAVSVCFSLTRNNVRALGSNVVSAIALAAIALSFCSVKQESKVFNKCVEEVEATGKSSSDAVHFCNGGK